MATIPAGTNHNKIPADLKKALLKDKKGLAAWNDITPLARNEWICWVETAKLIETRKRRIERTHTELAEGMRRPCCWPGCIHRERNGGFTIVELLIVVVVIAVLAAITIVAYNGITKKAQEAALLTEITQGYKKIETFKVTGGSAIYPPDAADADVRMNPDTAFFYVTNANATGYCLSATNKSGVYYRITSNGGSAQLGKCVLNVSTYLGNGSLGQVNGSGATIRFNNPTGAVMTPSGDMYIADYGNNVIRRATAGGVVSTFAGSTASTSGYTNDTGALARFYGPGGIAVDGAGILYVADQFNNAIRKITAAGVVTTLAGGSYGTANGTGAAAQFYYPWDLAVDSAGTVYVADTYNNMIRKITPAGVTTTLAGSPTAGYVNATGTAARFDYPSTIAIGPDGMLYVTDQDNNRIRKVDPSNGATTTLAGSGAHGTVDGLGTAAQFASPHGITVDPHGNVFVADEYSHAIRKIAPDGSVYTIAGGTEGFQDGSSEVAQFSHPLGLAVSSSGILYVIERGNNRIRMIQY